MDELDEQSATTRQQWSNQSQFTLEASSLSATHRVPQHQSLIF